MLSSGEWKLGMLSAIALDFASILHGHKIPMDSDDLIGGEQVNSVLRSGAFLDGHIAMREN